MFIFVLILTDDVYQRQKLMSTSLWSLNSCCFKWKKEYLCYSPSYTHTLSLNKNRRMMNKRQRPEKRQTRTVLRVKNKQ